MTATERVTTARGAVLQTPPRLSLAQLPTPLQRLDNLSREVGGPRLWIKRDDLTEGPAGGNKLRKLEFSVGQALAEDANVLITAGAKQSNHCRATASVAARLGLECHLVLAGRPPDGVLDGNLLLDDLMGADVTYIHPREIDRLPEILGDLADRLRAQGKRPFVIPLGATDAFGLWGYVLAARELQQDFERLGIAPRYVVCAVGTGGTCAGLALGAQLFGLSTRIVGMSVSRSKEVCSADLEAVAADWCRHAGLERSELDVDFLDDFVGPGYGRADAPVFSTIRRVARAEGLVFDPVYTGKSFDGLLRELAAGRLRDSEDLVFLHAGGLFGTFPHRASFA